MECSDHSSSLLLKMKVYDGVVNWNRAMMENCMEKQPLETREPGVWVEWGIDSL